MTKQDTFDLSEVRAGSKLGTMVARGAPTEPCEFRGPGSKRLSVIRGQVHILPFSSKGAPSRFGTPDGAFHFPKVARFQDFAP